MGNVISVRGAKEHNLKNVSLEIPKDSLVVITGLSGSGKSSLAFDTIYAEGQRRYVESLSSYARQFLNMAGKPDVEHIDGLSPAIAIDQKTTSRNPRSTVGTITEIHDYLRLLFANVGHAHCPKHPDIEISGQTVSQMVDAIVAWGEGARLQVMAPVVRGRKGEYRREMAEWQKHGFSRVRIDGEVYEFDEVPTLDKNVKHSIEVVVDRLAVREANLGRLADSFEVALNLAGGMVLVEEVVKSGEGRSALFSENASCPKCNHSYEVAPRLFSFNSPYGACKHCDGLGEIGFFDPNLVVPMDEVTLEKGAIAPWASAGRLNSSGKYYLKALARHYGFSLKDRWCDLTDEMQDILMHGSAGEEIKFTFEAARGNFVTRKPYDGVLNILARRYAEAKNPMDRDDINRYRASRACDACGGARLNADALAVTIDGKNLADINRMPILEAEKWAASLQGKLSGNRAKIAEPILREIVERLGFLNKVGLNYLSLERKSGTLSGGESQRIRLASQIGSGLTGVLYVLDEPSIGLHQRDNNRLLETLQRLKGLGNTILVVEHDEDAMRLADQVIDMGPKAGEHGGEVVAQGTVDEICKIKKSITGQYLSGKKKINVPKNRREHEKGELILAGVNGNNLKDVTVGFPLGVMTCVTGVSGSGKSTLVMETLHKAVARKLHGGKEAPSDYAEIKGLENIDKVVNIDQSPIGRTPRSNPATYTGVMSPIRDWFAALPEAKARGYAAGRFSFNVKGGRCEACQGDGLVKVEMHFLADVYVPCEVCGGRRYNRETLEVKYKGYNIADVLDMSVEAAYELFKSVPNIKNKLQTLMDVGLGYIKLGQSATTLSGGEAQRIKLAKELSKRSTGKTLYILDEPTTGLHFADIDQLLKVLHRLVDEGNSMVIIEHNLDVIKTADYVVDMGPEGGDGGGEVIACGTPEEVAKVKKSFTGKFLKDVL